MKIPRNNPRRLLVTLLLLAACAAGGPGAALEKYLKTVEAGEVKSAVAMFPKALQSQFGAKLVAMVESQTALIKKRGGIKEMNIVSEDVTGEIARVSVATRYGNGTVDTTSTKLLHEDNVWKINPE